MPRRRCFAPTASSASSRAPSFARGRKPLLDRCGKACRRVLKDAELTKEQLDGVILVGGSTRSPVVREFVAELFGKQPLSRSRSRSGRRARRRGPSRRARRRRPAGRAARCRAAVARCRDDGRRRREADPSQHHDPDRRDPDVRDVRGQPDRLRHPRAAGRARDRRRVSLARAVHAARRAADDRRAWRASRSRSSSTPMASSRSWRKS